MISSVECSILLISNKINAKNKTVPHGKWSAFRRDNGRLDWRPVTLQTPCGQIGRAVAECPSLQDKPFYIDRTAGAAGFKFGDVARMKCPNKILEGTDKSLPPRKITLNHVFPFRKELWFANFLIRTLKNRCITVI